MGGARGMAIGACARLAAALVGGVGHEADSIGLTGHLRHGATKGEAICGVGQLARANASEGVNRGLRVERGVIVSLHVLTIA